jgi:hypothetical protein
MVRNNKRKSTKKIMKKVRKEVKKDIKQIIRKPRAPKVTKFGNALRNLGGLAGAYFGAPGMGRQLGAGISKIFGQGDYTVMGPMVNGVNSAGGPPSFAKHVNSYRISHREYIRDVQSSVNFASFDFQINPGLPNSFPWLSKLAKNFERYRIHGLCFYLNSSSATAVSSTNTALGIWGMVTQYDAKAAPLITKHQCENYDGAVSAVPSASLIHAYEAKESLQTIDNRIVRTGPIPSTELNVYDAGKTTFFTQGSQAISTIGELWVTYDIEFFNSKVGVEDGNSFIADRYYNTGVTAPLQFGAPNAVPLAGSGIGTYFDASGTTLNVPATAPNTTYLLAIKYDASTAVANPFHQTPVATGSLSLFNLFTGNSQNNTFAPQTTVSQRWGSMMVTFNKTANSPGTIRFSTQTTSGATYATDVLIAPLGNGFNPALQMSYGGVGVDDLSFIEIKALREFMQSSSVIRNFMNKESLLTISEQGYNSNSGGVREKSQERVSGNDSFTSNRKAKLMKQLQELDDDDDVIES